MTISSLSIQVKPLNSPLQVGDKVQFALIWRPLRMIDGEVVQVSIPAGEWKSEWCYRIKYSFRNREGSDWIDHIDPSLYKIVV